MKRFRQRNKKLPLRVNRLVAILTLQTLSMQRVLVIGNCGAGKSTFSCRLAKATGLPLVHLDKAYWSAGWVEPPKEAWAARVQALVAEDAWIMDGNYSGTFHLRFPRADTVIWLDVGRWTCLGRILKRNLRYYGRARPDMASGCHERFSPAFLHYVFFGFPQRKERILACLAEFPGKAYVLQTRPAQERFLQGLPNS